LHSIVASGHFKAPGHLLRQLSILFFLAAQGSNDHDEDSGDQDDE